MVGYLVVFSIIFLFGYMFVFLVFFFNDTATTVIYTLSLHDALPISDRSGHHEARKHCSPDRKLPAAPDVRRSEEHTSELQSRENLVCRLLLEKKKKENTFSCPALYRKYTEGT